MADLRRNEHAKLAANWCNTLATAVVTVGILTPIAARLYGLAALKTDHLNESDLFVICVCVAVALHLTGQGMLELLRDTDD